MKSIAYRYSQFSSISYQLSILIETNPSINIDYLLFTIDDRFYRLIIPGPEKNWYRGGKTGIFRLKKPSEIQAIFQSATEIPLYFLPSTLGNSI